MSAIFTDLFDQVYRDHQAKVYKLALGLTGNTNDAEEITQEVFLRAFRSYDTFRAESSFFTWIYRITLNIAKDYLKQRAKLPFYVLTEDMGYSLEDIIDPNSLGDPETELLANEIRCECLHCLTECLPPNQRKVFCLAVTIGLPHKQVAEILECSLSSVKTTLHRAKQRIAGFLEDKCQFIKKSNPCNCRIWVRFALAQGWNFERVLANPRLPITIQAKDEIIKMWNLRAIYQNLYRDSADESLAQRIKEGINNKEWTILSEKTL